VCKRSLSLSVLIAVVFVAGAGCGGDDSPTEPTPVCSIAITPGNLSFGSQGGTGSVTINTSAGCEWNVTGAISWITLTTGGSGRGPGTVTYSVAANAGTESRNGTLMVGDQPHAVTQEGRAATVCTYDLSPTGAEFSKDATAGSFTVSAQIDCTWTAASNAAWLTVSSGHQGSGHGTVAYSVAQNADTSDRTGTITVAGRTFTVRQFGDYPACEYSVTPVEWRPCMPGGSLSATVTTQAHCSWTATSDAAWLGVANGISGTGSGAISMTFSDNYDAPRTGIVMVRWPTPTAGARAG